jgi:predicted methyltransferase
VNDSRLSKREKGLLKGLPVFLAELQPVFDHIGETDRMTLKFVKPKNGG